MQIKTLQLTNFLKHENLSIDLTSGVNVWYGKSAAGKSCLVEAIRFVQFPRETKGDSYIRQGSKKCSVKITYDNNISLERIKSKSVNQIIVTLPNGEVKEYTAFGKGEFPEDLQAILQLLPVTIDKESINLNILGQFDGHFLLDKSDTFKLKFFNYLTGSDVIDKVMQDLNKDILSCGREIKTNEEQLTNLQCSLNNTNVQYSEHKAKLDKANSLYEQIIKLQEKLNQLQQLSKQLTDNEVTIKSDTIKLQNLAKAKQVDITKLKELNNRLQELKKYQTDLQTLNASISIDTTKLNAKDSINKIDIAQMKVLNDKLKFLNKTKIDLEKIDNTITQLQEKLDTTVIAEIDFNKMRELVKKLEFLKKAQSDLTQVDDIITRLSVKLHEGKNELNLIEQEKIDLLKNLKGICPILKCQCEKLEVK
jgi:DNA repair exonuclease SbcCD ATPase subunit